MGFDWSNPIVVVYCQRYVKSTGIGTLASLMMPFSIAMLIGWSIFLIAYWMIGIPLGIQAPYTYENSAFSRVNCFKRSICDVRNRFSRSQK